MLKEERLYTRWSRSNEMGDTIVVWRYNRACVSKLMLYNGGASCLQR